MRTIERLRAELEKFKAIQNAVIMIKSFQMPNGADAPKKGTGKGRGGRP